MQYNLKLLMFMIILATSLINNIQAEEYQKSSFISLGGHYSLLDSPKDASDPAQNIFTDLGSWFGFSLPNNYKSNNAFGFIGPYLMHYKYGVWLSQSIINLDLKINSQSIIIGEEQSINSYFDKGKLHFNKKINGLEINQTLQYISINSALIETSILSDTEYIADLHWFGELLIQEAKYEKINRGFQVVLDNGLIIQVRFTDPNIDFTFLENRYEGIPKTTITIGEQLISNKVVISIFSEDEYMDTEIDFIESILNGSVKTMNGNKKRWDRYALSISPNSNSQVSFSAQQSIAAKSLLTLVNNWRAPYGELKYDGLFPSYARHYFRGFWAWDSWKHAVALVHFEPDIAKNQVRAMYDFQNAQGMIADCVFPDTTIENHNWRDTKPPLSAWAVWSIYEKTKDISFVAELYPQIVRYHEWWYKNRDHDGNGICEYGSTDGTEIAARWESGMDNAVRFDDIKMMKNNENAWSMNQESVDLNSYLFAEKNYLKKMANILGDEADVKKYKLEAAYLKKQIQSLMYDSKDGYFYDIKLDDKSFVKVKGPEGWIPLWANVASQAQADAIIEKILDPKIFNTKIPFPTLDASHSKFNPEKGYWRGPVWMDQAYFALRGLKQYGYEDEAVKLTNKIFNEIQHPSLYENYHPITGEGLNSPHFSWTAAHLYLMYIEILNQD